MGTLKFLIEDDTIESDAKRFVTLTLFGPDGSRRFVGLDGTPSDTWSGRWVTLTRVQGEPSQWEGSVSGVPPGRYYIQFRLVEDRNARPVTFGGGEVPAESIDVRLQPLPLAFVRGYAKESG